MEGCYLERRCFEMDEPARQHGMGKVKESKKKKDVLGGVECLAWESAPKRCRRLSREEMCTGALTPLTMPCHAMPYPVSLHCTPTAYEMPMPFQPEHAYVSVQRTIGGNHPILTRHQTKRTSPACLPMPVPVSLPNECQKCHHPNGRGRCGVVV